MAAQTNARDGARGSPAPFRQEDVDLLAAGEMPDEIVALILETGPPPKEARRGERVDKLAPVDLSAEEIEAAARGEKISDPLAERLEAAAKLDLNRKRAAGTKAARPEVTPPGERRKKR